MLIILLIIPPEVFRASSFPFAAMFTESGRGDRWLVFATPRNPFVLRRAVVTESQGDRLGLRYGWWSVVFGLANLDFGTRIVLDSE